MSNSLGVNNFTRLASCFFLMVLLGLSPLLLSAQPSETQLRAWRLASQGAKVAMLKEHAGRDFAVRVVFPGEPDGPTELGSTYSYATEGVHSPETENVKKKNGGPHEGAILMTLHLINTPLEAWIPPYIGINADKVRLAVLPVRRHGDAKLWVETVTREPILRRISTKQEINLSILPEGQWTELTFPVRADLTHRLAEVKLLLSGGKDAFCEFYFSSARIITKDGQEYELLNPRMPSYMEGMKMPLVAEYLPKGFKALPKRLPIFIGVSGNWGFIHEDAGNLPEFARFMAKYFPEHDVVMSFSRTPEAEMSLQLPKFPDNIFYQFQKAQHGIQYPALYDALPRDWRGQPQGKYFNSILATHPLLQTALKDQIDYAATIGFNNFCSFDYVWPYQGGLWGYDNATVAAFHQDLTGMDEGLKVLSETDRSSKVIHFWDYFKDCHGMTFTPADLGLKSWLEFFPPTEQDAAKEMDIGQRRLGVFLLLRSYEWLRQAQRFNQWAKAYGGTYDYLLNGDNWIDANDHVYLMRLVDTGIINPEYFMGYPGPQEFYYRTIGRYVRTAARTGKTIGYCLEVSNGGSGHPYWDLRTGYAVNYALSAQGFGSLHYDVPPTWAMHLSNPMDETNFKLFMAQSMAFSLTRLEKIGKLPAPEVLNVFQRDVGVRRAGTDNWDAFLVNGQVNYEETDPQELPLMLEAARVIFYSPSASRKDSAVALNTWLEQGGKTLVIHSYVPFNLDRGYADPGKSLNDPAIMTDTSLFPGFDKGKPIGKTILKHDDGRALLTVIEQAKGSRICYVHERLERLSPSERNQIAGYLIESLNLPLLQENNPDNNSMVTRFQGDGFQVVNIWNRKCTKAASDGRGEWLSSKWCWQKRFFDPDAYLFKWSQPGAQAKAVIAVDKPGEYCVYHFLSDREELLQVGKDRRLTLPLNGVLTELFYVAADTPAFREKVLRIKAERQKATPFLQETRETWNK